jgi:hypothetical protein
MEKLNAAATAIVGGLALTFATQPAQAQTYNCGAGTILMGEAGKNPVASTRVEVHDGIYTIAHTLMDGQVISRGNQYWLASSQEPSARYTAAWQGRLMKNPSLYMQGGIWYDDAGAHYDEYVYDNAHSNHHAFDHTLHPGYDRTRTSARGTINARITNVTLQRTNGQRRRNFSCTSYNQWTTDAQLHR